VALSVTLSHGRIGSLCPEPLEPPPDIDIGTPASPAQSHAQSHAWPAGHSGQLQVQVPGLPPLPLPLPPVDGGQPPPVGGLQLQSHGGQASPGAHAGQAQVQVPPPLPPPEAGPPSCGTGVGQSQEQGGQGWPSRQYSGQAHAHPPPLEPPPSPPWKQNPSPLQVVPAGHRVVTEAHRQWSAVSTSQDFSSECVPQGSIATHAPDGHDWLLLGQGRARSIQRQPAWPPHALAVPRS
jgi:hypothetical protein